MSVFLQAKKKESKIFWNVCKMNCREKSTGGWFAASPRYLSFYYLIYA